MATTTKYLKSGAIQYKVNSMMGSVLQSNERGVKEGDVRYIHDTLFYAYTVRPQLFKKSIVNWCFVDDRDYDGIRKWEKDL